MILLYMYVAIEHLLNLEGCPTLPSPPVNGYLCGLEDVASGKVQFCCERGYQLSGPSVSVCDRSNRQWNPMTGKCLRMYVYRGQSINSIFTILFGMTTVSHECCVCVTGLDNGSSIVTGGVKDLCSLY